MFVSEEMRMSRIVSGGKVASLASAFALENDKPFSIFLKPGSSSETSQVLSVTLLGASEPCDFPFVVGEWSPVLIKAINSTTAEASGYDIYWGSGEVASVEE